MKKSHVIALLIAVFILAACGKGAVPTTGATEAQIEGSTESTPIPPAATSTDEPPSGSPALAPDPQEVTFQASDGQELKGLYYPAAINPAPVVVFMHWVGGDKSDWYEIAVWLQNRGQANPFPNPSDEPWWDPTWFPAVPADRSYGVFIFSFRGCTPYKVGCTDGGPEVWLLDAQAAMLEASQLEGVDPTQIVAIGSSIGADGAPDACFWLNEQKPGSCKGALSLSPGGFLKIPYPVAVLTLGKNQPPVAAWCLADETEFGVCESAEMVDNPEYMDFMIPGGGHGNMLLRPGLEPLPMQTILDFLSATVDP
ncbi:MAG: hypothetical protein ABIF04_07440 [Chloroflexota bacterium]